MAFDPHANFGYSVVTVAPSPALSGTSLDVADASIFPATPFNATVWPTGQQALSTNAEIIRVTNIVGNTLTILRAQEGSTARAIVITDQIANTITRKVIEDVEAAIPSTVGLLSAINVSAGTTSNNLSALTFSNANGLAFGLNGSTLTGSYTTPAPQTGISSIVASDATYTSGAVRFTGVGGGVTVNSNTGQRVDISVAAQVAQSVQTQNLQALSLGGNTAGVQTIVSSGTVVIAGGNNITVSQNGQSITISAANAGGAQTAISGIVVSDTTYTSGTVSFSAQNNITIGSSVNGGTQYVRLSVGNYLTTAMASNRASDFVAATAGFNGTNASGTIASNSVSVSVAAPVPIGTSVNPVASASSVGTVTRYAPEDHRHAGIGAVGISTSGNTAGTTGSKQGTYWFEGGNSITVSQITSNNGSHTLVLSVGNYLTTAMASNRASDFVAATAAFHGTNASGTIASADWSVSVAAQSNQSAIKAFGVSNTGATAGNTGVSTGIDWVLAGSQSITLSQSTAVGGPNTVWVQHPAWITTAMASNAVTLSNVRVSAGTTSNLLSALTFADGSGVSWGINASTITATVKTDYLTSQSTQFLALTLGGNSLGTSTFHASNNATIFLHGGNNITLSGNGSSITISGPNAGGAQTGISGVIVSDATYSSGTISFSNAGNITISSSVNGVTQYVRLSGNAAQTVQSAIKGFGVSDTGQTAGNTGISTGIDWVLAGSQSITLSQSTAVGGPNTVWFQHPAWLTTAMASNRGSDFVAATAAFAGTNASGTIASNGISVSVAAPAGGVIGTSVNPVASASSVGTVTRYAPEDHRHAGIGGIGISTSGNTAGTTGSVVGTYWFEGGNSITVSQITSNNGSHTLRLSVGNYLTTAMASNRASDFVAATAAFNGTNASGTIASDAISVSVAAPIPIGTSVNPVASASSVGTVTRYAPEDHRHPGVGGIGISTSGNTAGTTGSKIGTYWFEGGNSITVSQITSNNGSHTLVLSVGNYLTTAMASNRASDFVAATAGFNGTNASGTIASNSWSVSVAAPIPIGTSVNPVASASSVGTVTRYAPEDHRHPGVGGIGISTSGNTAGTTGSQIGTYWFEGGNSITVSQITSNNGSHTLRLSVGAYLTTAMASNRGSDFVQATAGFNGTNASGTIASNSISVSVAAPIPIGTSVNPVASASSVGTVTRYAPEDHRHPGVGGIGISTSGNTAGTTGSQIGTYWFEGGNSITVSQITSNNGSHTLRLSVGNYLTTAMASNRGSDFVAATAAFAGTNASGTIASDGISVSVNPPGGVIGTSVNPVASASSVGTVTRYAPEDHRHAGIGAIGISTSGNSAGTSGSNVGTYWFQGGNSLTVSQITSNNGSHTLVLSVGNYLTTAMASNRGSDFVAATAGFNGTNASGTIASNSWSVSVAAPIPIGTAVKAVASVGSTGTITRYAPEDHQHAGVAAFAVTNTGNTAGNTRSQVGTLYLAASGAITASQSTAAAGNDTVWLSVASQTNQTLGLYALSNTTGQSSSSTFDARTLSFYGDGIASVGYSNGSVVISVPAGGGGLSNIRVSAGTTSNLLSALTFADSNGVSFGISASTITATVSTYSTVGTATSGYPVASANSIGTVTRWAAEDHRHAGIGGLGISDGNTAGTSGSLVGSYWLKGGNNITISQITSNNGSHTAIFSGPNLATLSHYANLGIGFIDAASTLVTCGVSVLQVVPFLLPQAISGLYLRVPVSMSYVSTEVSGTTANSTWTVNRGYTQAVAIMTQNVGASSLSLAYSTSTSATWIFQNVIGAGAQGSRYTITQNVSYPISGTTSNYTTSYAQSSANVQISSASMTLFTGPRYADIAFGISLSPGFYWAAFGMSTSSGTTGGGNSAAGAAGASFSTAAMSHSALSWGYPGAVTNSSIQIMPGNGSWSTNAAVMSSSSLQLASISIQANNPMIGFQIDRFA